VQVDARIYDVFASPDNRSAVAFDRDRFFVVDLEDGQVVHEGDFDLVPFRGDFSPDGRRFVIGSELGQVRMLDVETGTWVGPPRTAHDGRVGQVAYAPDGNTLVSGSDDGAIVLWDGRTGALLSTVATGLAVVLPEFLPDGHTVLIASGEASVASWDTSPESWIEFACTVAGRNLTEAEWREAFDTRPYHATCPDGGS
jgi:WD domain, G-beta repeat